jgi:DNA-binding NtrC family response regulator
MARNFQKDRPRLLVICKAGPVRDDLITLLTGYGYYVDYQDCLEKGLDSYREHKQAIIIIDTPSLPPYPERMFRAFHTCQRHPILLIAAYPRDHARLCNFLHYGAFDIIELPLKTDYLGAALRRVVEHGALLSRAEYLRAILALVSLSCPIWLILAAAIGAGWR